MTYIRSTITSARCR